MLDGVLERQDAALGLRLVTHVRVLRARPSAARAASRQLPAPPRAGGRGQARVRPRQARQAVQSSEARNLGQPANGRHAAAAAAGGARSRPPAPPATASWAHLLAHANHHALVARTANDGREHGAGSVVASEASLRARAARQLPRFRPPTARARCGARPRRGSAPNCLKPRGPRRAGVVRGAERTLTMPEPLSHTRAETSPSSAISARKERQRESPTRPKGRLLCVRQRRRLGLAGCPDGASRPWRGAGGGPLPLPRSRLAPRLARSKTTRLNGRPTGARAAGSAGSAARARTTHASGTQGAPENRLSGEGALRNRSARPQRTLYRTEMFWAAAGALGCARQARPSCASQPRRRSPPRAAAQQRQAAAHWRPSSLSLATMARDCRMYESKYPEVDDVVMVQARAARQRRRARISGRSRPEAACLCSRRAAGTVPRRSGAPRR